MTRPIILSIGEFYHIYNRGTEKRKIFLSKHDYERFIALLYLCNSTISVRIDMRRKSLDETLDTDRDKNLVDIGSYCLMPNHFHILLKERVENGISLFMQKLTTAYTMYFNKKYERNGSLFQGTFKAEHADKDSYLKYLFAYIHLNPVKLIEPEWKKVGIKNRTNAKQFLRNYPYSSYFEYTGIDRKWKTILTPKAFPDYFDTTDGFQKMIDYWLEFSSEQS
ncbi:MAG: transposase [bacterium]|nr:transposase [bacterium]